MSKLSSKRIFAISSFLTLLIRSKTWKAKSIFLSLTPHWGKIGEKVMELGNIAAGTLIFTQMIEENFQAYSILIGLFFSLLCYFSAIILLSRGRKYNE